MVGRCAVVLIAALALPSPIRAANGFTRSADSDSVRSAGIPGAPPAFRPVPALRSIALDGSPVRVTMDVLALRGTRTGNRAVALEANLTVELPANARVLSVQRHEGVLVVVPRNAPQSEIPDVFTVTLALPREVVTQTFNFTTLRASGWELPRGFVRDVLWRTSATYDARSTPFAPPASRVSAIVERGDYSVAVDVLDAVKAPEGAGQNTAKRYILTVSLPPGCTVAGVQRHEGASTGGFARSEAFSVTLLLDGVLRTHTFDFTGMVAGDWVLAPTGLERIHWRSRP